MLFDDKYEIKTPNRFVVGSEEWNTEDFSYKTAKWFCSIGTDGISWDKNIYEENCPPHEL